MSKQGYFFEDLELGMNSTYARKVTQQDIEIFAEVSGDDNPLHLDEDYASTTLFKGCIAHGMLSAAYISKIMGTQLPGPGAIYISQSLRFRAPVRAGDTVDTHAEVTALDEQRNRATFACICKVGETIVVDGEAQVMVPSRKG